MAMNITIGWFIRSKNRLWDYIYDQTVDVKDWAFIVFSGTVLVALFLAVPAGDVPNLQISNGRPNT